MLIQPKSGPAMMWRTARSASIVAPAPAPRAIDALACVFPDSPVVRTLRALDCLRPPIVHTRRR